ncbi:MAG TPA: hypothetical protein VGM27_11530 [Acidobacteriaceae bacterium]
MIRRSKKAMVVRHASAKSNGSIVQETLRAFLSRNPILLGALEFLCPNAAENLSFQELRVQPLVATHRNLISAEPFLLPRERFGGSQDLAMVPLVRNVVDKTLRAYASSSPYLLEYVGKTPISPYGSMALSVSRWGHVDWDYIRDLDWRIFLPSEIGHLSGFKSYLERSLTQELHKYGLYAVLFGKDEHGHAQVQLRDNRTAAVHGFHLFLIAMKPGFVRGNLHRDGGYSPHFAYFPESSLDEHLESAKLLWSDSIAQQRQDYVDMFDQLSFNIFGENTGKDRLYKTRGWYLHKAFKWYATLARARGLSALEEDLLYQYEHFRGSEAELSYLARYRYYARMAPSQSRLDDVERDLARAASIAYARARNSQDPLVGQRISVEGADIILLETVPENFAVTARRVLEQIESSLPDRLKCTPNIGRIRFADNLPTPSGVHLDGHEQAALIPAGWSLVFCDSYVCQVAKEAAKVKRSITEEDIRQALAVLLSSLLWPASQLPGGSNGPVPTAPLEAG